VLDTRYNRLLLVKSKMTDAAEALNSDIVRTNRGEVCCLQSHEIVRTNSLPSSRRRSRFQ